MLKRILLFVDGSPEMLATAAAALNLARIHGGQLLLYPVAARKAEHGADLTEEQRFAPILQMAENAGVGVQVLATTAAPFRTGLPWALTADLAVVPYPDSEHSARCEKRLGGLLTRGGCPVLLPCTESGTSRTVAIAWDGSGTCARALKLHLQLFHRPHYHYLLLHIGAAPDSAQYILDQGCALVEAHGATVETLALSGDPAERLLEICAAVHPGHLLLAPGLRRLVLKQRFGRTSKSVLRARSISLFFAG
ncbi:MAG TPA: universal stress protein [bacterium]|nr:universal stress protein [bacterium]HPR87258.1 universal stress protein [bacterium]